MAETFLQLARDANRGDKIAIQTLLTDFAENKFSTFEQEQIHLFLKQEARTNHYAVYVRAILFERGLGVPQDVEMAFILMREAAGKGNEEAIYEVGHRLLEGIGIDKNEIGALQWLKMAAGSPYYHPDAMYDLGRMYEFGLNVETDTVQSLEWYQKAAKMGSELAREKIKG